MGTVRVISTCGISTATFTRPANYGVYAAGDAITNATSGASVMTFKSALREGHGCIQQAILLDSANQSTLLDAELWLFDTAPNPTNDNANITFSDGELARLVTIIDFPVADMRVGIPTAGAGGNAVNVQHGLAIPVVGVLGSNDIYGVLIARNAYAPLSAERFTVTLGMVY